MLLPALDISLWGKADGVAAKGLSPKMLRTFWRLFAI
jgi:hypothetical protein